MVISNMIFSVSQHYAFIALDIATKTRYVKSLDKPVVLTDSKKSQLRRELRDPTYNDIESFAWKQKGWDALFPNVN